MKTLNKVMLLGSVGKDPEIKATAGGTIVANFSLATNERRKDAQGSWQEETSWHNLVAFGKTAEVIRDYVQKGTPIHVEGRIQNRTWEKDGQKHYRSEVVIDQMILLGGGKKGEQPAKAAPQETQEIDSEDIPF